VAFLKAGDFDECFPNLSMWLSQGRRLMGSPLGCAPSNTRRILAAHNVRYHSHNVWKHYHLGEYMELRDVIYEGPPIDDQELLARLPHAYRQILEQINGFIQFSGGLHIRGVCATPRWHALAEVWFGDHALPMLYSAVRPADIPFGQDALGDQFLMRDTVVHRLSAETGELESLGCTLLEFLERAQNDPVGYLSLQPMLQFYTDGGTLTPGQLLNVYPPFCTKEAAKSVSLRAIPTLERIRFLADLARQLATIPDGTQVRFEGERQNDDNSGTKEL
jgi:hypothetical protein